MRNQDFYRVFEAKPFIAACIVEYDPVHNLLSPLPRQGDFLAGK
jgi:hypothetical protein